MTKEENVIKFYVLCNRLKDLIRTGWLDWHVKRDRLESVAEHIYSTQMLAIAIHSEYNYSDIDLGKVIFLLAIHELGEIIIGDLTQFQISKEEKKKIEHEAVHKLLKNLISCENLEKLFIEFEEQKSKEAFFAYQCDKLECDLQSCLYDEEDCVDITNQTGNKTINNPQVKELLENELSFSKMWLEFGRRTYPYDQNFQAISNYASTNNISTLRK